MDTDVREGIEWLAARALANVCDLDRPDAEREHYRVDFFSGGQSRRYRLRRSGPVLVAVRRLASGRFLRVEVTAIPRADFDDGEKLAEFAWWGSAYRGIADRAKIDRGMRAARRRPR